MWKIFEVELQMTGKFAASVPKSKEGILAMLQNRMPAKPPPDFIPIEELAEEVAAKVNGPGEGEETEDDELKYGWATFLRNEEGLYYEGRGIRGHLKDCANQIKDILQPPVKALKAKVSNKVYVETDIIPLDAKEPSGTEQLFVQVLTPRGPRSSIKYIDFLEKPLLKFRLKVLDDDVITKDILDTIFEYGCVHGVGQERSQGWGRYTYKITAL